MNNGGGIWFAVCCFGVALVVAANVGFGLLGGWLAVGVVVSGYGFLYRDSVRAMDAWYKRVDRDAG